jgi:AcrR family transcriptional regulator
MAPNKPKEIRIAEIVEAAVLEFVDKGFENASMNSIAKRAKLSKGGIYHHFNSKDDLLLAANKKVTQPAGVILEKLNRLDEPKEKIDAYISGYLGYWANHSNELIFTFLSLSKSLSNTAFFQPYEDYALKTVRALSQIFEEGIEKKIFRPHDSKARAMALCSALDGATMYLKHASVGTLETIVGHFKNVFLNDIQIGA